MPQPSGQVLLDPARPNHAARSFWYCDGSNLWDAKAGATLAKTGAAGTAVEGGANVVLGNGSTYYALASALSLAGNFTIAIKARLTTNSQSSMLFGSRSNTNNFFWLGAASTIATLRINGASQDYVRGDVLTSAVYTLVRSGTSVSVYRDSTLIATKTHAGTFSITHILSGYTGTSFITNGAVEFMHVMDGVALDATGVASYVTDPYQDLAVASGQTITAPLVDAASAIYNPSVTQTGGPQTVSPTLVDSGASAYAPVLSFPSSITLTSPTDYQSRQRDLVSNTAALSVALTYTGAPSGFEYRFAGGTWAPLGGVPSGGSHSATVTLPTGQGTFEVRFSNATGVTDSAAYVTVGDGYIVAGQSNHAGRASSVVAPVSTNFVVTKLRRNGTWKQLTEATTGADTFDEGTGAQASYFGALSNRLQDVGVPVFFAPCAEGSTSINDWARHDPDPTNPYFLYGDMRVADQRMGGHRAVLWLQGETDAANGMAQATYETRLNELVDDWHADTGKPFFIIQIVRWQSSIYAQIDAIRAAQAAVAASNPNVAGIVDGNVASWQSANDVHYTTTTQINDLADVVGAGMVAAFYSKRAQLTLTTNGTTPAASLTGIRWAWWDAAPPNLAAAPVDSGTGATTDASGVFSVELPNTTLASGDTGTLLAVINDGTAGSTANRAFCAPVEVT
jgi:hypothetical protein